MRTGKRVRTTMLSSEITPNLFISDSDSKIVLVVVDGLGGLPDPATGLTELQTASLPHLDALAASGSCGCISPIGPGITPGSGPAHLALLGYDPWVHDIGRGALAALGLGMDFREGDIAARLNFCSVDADGVVTDRRAGRISTDECRKLCELLGNVSIPGVQVTVERELEYRATAVFRGPSLSARLDGSDPQQDGLLQRPVVAQEAAAERMAEVASDFLAQAKILLAEQGPANMVLIRGFGAYPTLPKVADIYGLKALGVAGYPMYRGVAVAVGMDIVECEPDIDSEVQKVSDHYDDYDLTFIHIKTTDSAGEDGDFERKVKSLEAVDACIPRLLALNPEVLIVTGDHSTPSVMGRHSWHPVPLVIKSSWGLPNADATFSEIDCQLGSLGPMPSTALMALALAHAERLEKFGA